MQKFLYRLFVLMISGSLFAQEYQPDPALKSAIDRYVELINHLGGDKTFDPEKAARACAPDCKKIFNGKLEVSSREEFVAQLLSLKQKEGCWVIRPVETIVSTQDHTAVIRLIITLEKGGIYTALVILRFTPELLVKEVNEVFNQWEGSEDEIPKTR
jgi:hypothetical protein